MAPAARRFVNIVKIGAVVAVAVAVLRALRGRRTPPVTGEASWPPLDEPAETPTSTRLATPLTLAEEPPETTDEPEPTGSADEAEAEPAAGWVDPVDGVCPASHPVKGNADSGIYHVPGGTFYDRTTPERCYVSAEAAEADGFRRAKR